MTRYAIYFAPDAASDLWRFGSGVIGYDAATSAEVPFAETAGLAPDAWAAFTDEPRRYGFHATLKAPFELAAGVGEADLLAAGRDLARSLEAVSIGALEVAEIGRFIALVPAARSEALQALAAEVVVRLDHLRAPLSDADRARRLKSPLTARQIEYLDRYGYPYVLDEFRFHMTLTGPIAEAVERTRIRQSLRRAYERVVAAEPRAVVVDALTVFRQERRDGRFRIVDRMPLKAR